MAILCVSIAEFFRTVNFGKKNELGNSFLKFAGLLRRSVKY